MRLRWVRREGHERGKNYIISLKTIYTTILQILFTKKVSFYKKRKFSVKMRVQPNIVIVFRKLNPFALISSQDYHNGVCPTSLSISGLVFGLFLSFVGFLCFGWWGGGLGVWIAVYTSNTYNSILTLSMIHFSILLFK